LTAVLHTHLITPLIKAQFHREPATFEKKQEIWLSISKAGLTELFGTATFSACAHFYSFKTI
jgi:hypothetical protein